MEDMMPQTKKSGPLMKPRRMLSARLVGGKGETGGPGKKRSYEGNPTKGGKIATMRGKRIRSLKW
jgi:hypothetical protein